MNCVTLVFRLIYVYIIIKYTGPTKKKWRSAIEKHNCIDFLRSKNRKLSRKPIARKIIARKCARELPRPIATRRDGSRRPASMTWRLAGKVTATPFWREKIDPRKFCPTSALLVSRVQRYFFILFLLILANFCWQSASPVPDHSIYIGNQFQLLPTTLTLSASVARATSSSSNLSG